MNNTSRTTIKSLATLGVALTLVLSGCGRGGGENSAAAETKTVSLAVSTLNNPFFVDLRDGAQQAAKELGVTLEVLDAQNDSATQANQIADTVTGGTDALVVNPVDSDAAGAAVAPAINANLPVIAVDRTVNGAEIDSLISSDNVAGGEQAAQALAAAIGEKGKVVVLQGVAGTSASRDRGEGFQKGISQYDGIEVVATQTANFDRAEALDVATNLLQSHPDIVGIFAENDEMALGAIEALGDRAGKDVFVVGFDGTDDALTAIDQGTMEATIAQQPKELGRQALEAVVKVLDGETVAEDIPVPVETITQDNVGEYLK